MRYDRHVHTGYSDGAPMAEMVRAAADAGLSGVGFADHCNVTDPEVKRRYGFDLDETYERRRADIEALEQEVDLTVFDAVEMDYYPDDERSIRRFLRDAGFEYSLGSVHYLDGFHVMKPGPFADASRADRREFVDRYFDALLRLVDSQLFDVAAHVDVVERNPALRGLATRDHYERLAESLADSRTVPEVNAGRVFASYGTVHPHPDLLGVLADAGVEFVPGSDAHEPPAVEERSDYLRAFFEERELPIASL